MISVEAVKCTFIQSDLDRQQIQDAVMFFLRHVNKNYLNVLIELWPNPGLV